MRSPLPAVLAFALAFVGCSHPSNGPLSFQLPAGWKMKHKAAGGFDFYTVTVGTGDQALLMFSQWPAPSRPEDIPGLVQKLADAFRNEAKRSSIALASQQCRMEQFAGSQCQGSCAVFQTSSGSTKVLQKMFMMTLDGR